MTDGGRITVEADRELAVVSGTIVSLGRFGPTGAIVLRSGGDLVATPKEIASIAFEAGGPIQVVAGGSAVFDSIVRARSQTSRASDVTISAGGALTVAANVDTISAPGITTPTTIRLAAGGTLVVTGFIRGRGLTAARGANVVMRANTLRLDGTAIQVAASSGGVGGKIDIAADDLIVIDGASLRSGLAGVAGDIDIGPTTAAYITGSQINAVAESGGTVVVDARALILVSSSLVGGDEVVLRTSFTGTDSQASQPKAVVLAIPLVAARCGARAGGETSTFVQRSGGGIPTAPDRWLEAVMVDGEPAAANIRLAAAPGRGGFGFGVEPGSEACR
jgi:hypothetical protein